MRPGPDSGTGAPQIGEGTCGLPTKAAWEIHAGKGRRGKTKRGSGLDAGAGRQFSNYGENAGASRASGPGAPCPVQLQFCSTQLRTAAQSGEVLM